MTTASPQVNADVAGSIFSLGSGNDQRGMRVNVSGDIAGGNVIKDCDLVTVNTVHGTLLQSAPRPAVERHAAVPQPPRAPRGFRDRADEQKTLAGELRPSGGVWLRGASGCGLSALLRQAAALPAPQLPDGVVLLDGAQEPAALDDMLQRLFERFYASDVAVRVTPNMARSYLGSLRALVAIDRPTLGRNALESLADALAGGSLLIAGDGSGPETLLDLPINGLPRSDSLALCSAASGIELTQPATALLDPICAALGDLPLPLVLTGGLLRAGAAPRPLLTALANQPADDDPLTRIVRVLLAALSDAARSVLAALLGAGGPDVSRATLIAISRLPDAALDSAIERLNALRLVERSGERFAIAFSSLRHTLARLLDTSTERSHAAAFFAGIAALHAGDLTWIGNEASNLLSAIKTALSTGQHQLVGPLAKTLQPWLTLYGQWTTWGDVIDWAETAARATNNDELLAWALHERGTRAGLLGNQTLAESALRAAVQLRKGLDDQVGRAFSEHNLRHLGLLPPAPVVTARLPIQRLLAIGFLCVGLAVFGWRFVRPSAGGGANTPTAIRAIIAEATRSPSIAPSPETSATIAVTNTLAIAVDTPTATQTATATPSASVFPSMTLSPTSTESATPSEEPTETPTSRPSETPTETPTSTPNATPTSLPLSILADAGLASLLPPLSETTIAARAPDLVVHYRFESSDGVKRTIEQQTSEDVIAGELEALVLAQRITLVRRDEILSLGCDPASATTWYIAPTIGASDYDRAHEYVASIARLFQQSCAAATPLRPTATLGTRRPTPTPTSLIPR